MNKKMNMVFLISVGAIAALFIILDFKGYVDVLAAAKTDSVSGLGYIAAYGIGVISTGGLLVGLLKYAVSKRMAKDEK